MARLTDRVRNDLKCVEGPSNVNQTKPNFKILIDFRQFLYDYVEKVLFKADIFLHDRNAKANNTSTQSKYTPPGAKAFLLVTDNRRSQLDSPFCQSHSTGKLNLVITDKVRRYAVQELTMQLSQTFIFSYSTNQCFKQL